MRSQKNSSNKRSRSLQTLRAVHLILRMLPRRRRRGRERLQ